MIIFQNAGEADLTALTTFGVNVKETKNPIGFFGTGFKYAVAVLLRTGHRVLLSIGRRNYEFIADPVVVREQTVNVVHLKDVDGFGRQPLGYTTAMGKSWQVWMAYRELWCNAHDELEPLVWQTDQRGFYVPGKTQVVVIPLATSGPDGTIEDAHVRRAEFLLATKPLWANAELEIHPGPGRGIFYRGVRVHELPKPALYTYNLRNQVVLTEDRTLLSELSVRWMIERALLGDAPAELLEPALLARKDDMLEAELNYATCYATPSPQFNEVMARLLRTRAADVLPSAIKKYETYHARHGELSWHEPDEQERAMLSAARDLANRCLPVTSLPIRVVQSLGAGVLGLARNDTIVISRECLSLGVGATAGTLIEEYLHLAEGLDDTSRALQNRLLNLLVSALGGGPAEPKEEILF